ncbi:MAG: ribonuclease HII [Rhodoluna sp.]
MSSKTSQLPSLSFENSFFETGTRFVIGIDEVGRGSIAGPVAVGVCLLDKQRDLSSWPVKLKDSKLITEKTREEIFPLVSSWVSGWAVGMATVEEIETKGIVESLSLAGSRALEQLIRDPALREALAKDGVMVILDGSHNWLGSKALGMPVTVKTKADRDCVSVACASVLAKVTRDKLMLEIHDQHPMFGLASNKGYASESHISALREHGPSPVHRVSWLTKILAR